MAEVTIDSTAAKMTLKKVNPIKDFIAGGVGGACLVITGHPLDTFKVSLDKQDIFYRKIQRFDYKHNQNHNQDKQLSIQEPLIVQKKLLRKKYKLLKLE
jgi:hypothetical protein